MKKKYYTQKQNGFTLLELMIVIIILGILAAFAIPSYQRMLERQDINKYANQFRSSLTLARQMASVSGRGVTVCPVEDLTVRPWACSDNWDSLDNSTLYKNTGWIVFYDSEELVGGVRTGDGAYTEDSKDKLYKRIPFNSDKTAVEWTNGGAIRLSPRGSTGDAGTLRLFTPKLSSTGHLATWDSNNPPAMDGLINEARVSLTSLGLATLKK